MRLLVVSVVIRGGVTQKYICRQDSPDETKIRGGGARHLGGCLHLDLTKGRVGVRNKTSNFT